MQEQDSAPYTLRTTTRSTDQHGDRSRSRDRSQSWGRPAKDRSRSRSRSRSRGRSGSRNRDYSRHDSEDAGKSRGHDSRSPSRSRGLHGSPGSSSRRGWDRDRDRDDGIERRPTDRGYNSPRTDGYHNDGRPLNPRHEGNSRQRQQSWRRNDSETQEEPQLEVILQGLPQDCQENDIRAVIESEDIGLETMRIARDRLTGESRGFGFLRFYTLHHAQEFMRRFLPSIRIGQNWVRIAYSNNPSSSRDSYRRCPECGMNDGHQESCRQFLSSKQGFAARPGPYLQYQHKQQPQHQLPHHYQDQRQLYSMQAHQASGYQRQLTHEQSALNVGASDIGAVPNSILVVTNLPSLVNEWNLWKALSALGPLVQIMLAKDRQSRISWGFCFAEFTDVKSAAMALDKANEDGFTIQDKPVEVHYAHHGSFIPAYAPTQWTVSLGAEDTLAIYWDEQAFLSVYADPSTAAIARKPAPSIAHEKSSSKSTTSTDELDAFYAALGDSLKPGSGPSSRIDATVFSVPTAKDAAGPLAPTPAPVIQDLPALPTTAKMDKVQLAGIAAAQAAEQLAKAEEKKRKAGQASIGLGGGGKKVSIQLQKWSSKQVELQSGEAPQEFESAKRPPVLSSPSVSSLPSHPQPEHQLLSEEQRKQEDFTLFEPDELLDLNLTACLLCQRRLKTVQDLRKHQSLSDLHKKNLQDPQAIETALRKSRGLPPQTSSASKSSSISEGVQPRTPVKNALTTLATPPLSVSPMKIDDEPKYRDRAAERRQIFGQPDYPLPPTPSGRDFGGRGGGGRYGGGAHRGGGFDQEIIVTEQPTKDGIKDDNIGNRLLKSMGWKEGQGLGKDGDGIKAPIEASSYSKGVGIGAGVVRKADGASQSRGLSGNYAESAKELARRRYEQSG